MVADWELRAQAPSDLKRNSRGPLRDMRVVTEGWDACSSRPRRLAPCASGTTREDLVSESSNGTNRPVLEYRGQSRSVVLDLVPSAPGAISFLFQPFPASREVDKSAHEYGHDGRQVAAVHPIVSRHSQSLCRVRPDVRRNAPQGSWLLTPTGLLNVPPFRIRGI